jgi:DNA-binding response OmpR family regulator
LKILITDDDATSRLVLEATLKKLGHEVVVTESGGQAWEALRQEYFPVLISDWLMPLLDGLMLCRMIRDTMQSNYTYIILLTVMQGKANYLEAMEAGADDFITKPFDEEELAARLQAAERILGLRRHVKQLEGLLSICGYCKRIQEQGNWYQLEYYISQHSGAKFSTTYCPDCYDKFIQPELEQLRRERRSG